MKTISYLIKIRITAFLALAIFVLSTSCMAATYYVDLDGGNDTSNGLSTATAWRNLPGTRNVDDTGWLSGATGWVSLKPGDIIKIKSGTTHDATKGGRILIDGDYYEPGTPSLPITIKADTSWGSGQIVIDGTRMTVPRWQGLFEIRQQYVTVDGVNADGIKVQNSAHNGIRVLYNGVSGVVLRNMEAYHCVHANVLIQSDQGPSIYIQDITLDGIHSHGGVGGDAYYSGILLSSCDRALVTNCKSHDNGPWGLASDSTDGIHLSDSRNCWIENCVVYNNGNQGIDISKGYKDVDDSYNITVRDCYGYNNFKHNFDSNSTVRDVYFIRCVSWKNGLVEVGDGGFQVYQGGQRIFFINCTSAGIFDYGFGIGWWGYYYSLPPGSYHNYLINCVSSNNGGASVFVESDLDGRSFVTHYYNSNFYSVDRKESKYAVSDKKINYSRENINNSTNGWPGAQCRAVDPMFISFASNWETTNLGLKDSSSVKEAAAFVFVTSATGNGTTITLDKLVNDLDARRVFRPGDSVQIEGSTKYHRIASVPVHNQITLASQASWTSGKGVWFPWNGQRPDMGAFHPLPHPKNLSILTPRP